MVVGGDLALLLQGLSELLVADKSSCSPWEFPQGACRAWLLSRSASLAQNLALPCLVSSRHPLFQEEKLSLLPSNLHQKTSDHFIGRRLCENTDCNCCLL